jgi:hypothetical protein
MERNHIQDFDKGVVDHSDMGRFVNFFFLANSLVVRLVKKLTQDDYFNIILSFPSFQCIQNTNIVHD